MEQKPTKRWRAMWQQLCPRCRKGKAFRGLVAMNEHCPVCGFRFGREEGYFTGAMYASYFLSAGFLGPLTLLLWWLLYPGWQFRWIFALATLLFVPFIPMIFRYSRIIWLYLDWAVDPE